MINITTYSDWAPMGKSGTYTMVGKCQGEEVHHSLATSASLVLAVSLPGFLYLLSATFHFPFSILLLLPLPSSISHLA